MRRRWFVRRRKTGKNRRFGRHVGPLRSASFAQLHWLAVPLLALSVRRCALCRAGVVANSKQAQTGQQPKRPTEGRKWKTLLLALFFGLGIFVEPNAYVVTNLRLYGGVTAVMLRKILLHSSL